MRSWIKWSWINWWMSALAGTALFGASPVDFGITEFQAASAARNRKLVIKTELSLDPPETFRIEPYTAGGFNYETAHFCDLIREGLLESPEIPHSLSISMARLLEQARTALGVRFPGE